MPLHITSIEIYEAAVLRIGELKEAAEGTADQTDLIALVDVVARWECDQGLPAVSRVRVLDQRPLFIANYEIDLSSLNEEDQAAAREAAGQVRAV